MIERFSRKIYNIAGRLLENSRNSFVDLQSQKEIDQKSLLNAQILHFDSESVNLIAASNSCSQKTLEWDN